MDLKRVLAELRCQQQQIHEAIMVLERIGGGRRRGRPPKWMSTGVTEESKKARIANSEARKQNVEAK